jgi:hypothetical protein
LERRLRRLERTPVTPAEVLNQIQHQALRGISDDDLTLVEAVAARGEPYLESVPEERAALEHYVTQLEAAALRITKRTLSSLGIRAWVG